MSQRACAWSLLPVLLPAIAFAAPMVAPLVAQVADVGRQDAVPAVTVSPGVTLRELTGRTAAARSDQASVAWFRLDAGRASAWSHNRSGEESFFILTGHGEIRTGTRRQPVGPGSFVLVPPAMTRSIAAAPGEALTFYAVTSPAWSRQDDVLDAAPGSVRQAIPPG